MCVCAAVLRMCVRVSVCAAVLRMCVRVRVRVRAAVLRMCACACVCCCLKDVCACAVQTSGALPCRQGFYLPSIRVSVTAAESNTTKNVVTERQSESI